MMSQRALGYGAAAAGLAAMIVIAAVTAPPRPEPILNDQLGPESGEQVSAYLARAHASLPTDSERHYALVSFSTETSVAFVYGMAATTRVSQVLFRVPIPRVQTPIITIPVSSDPQSITEAQGLAALAHAGVESSVNEPAALIRAQQVDAVSHARLTAGCACVLAAVVYSTPDQLRDIAGKPGVRAVEALPADAVYGHFSVRPLLPEQTETVVPGPDDGPVPQT